MFSAQILYFVYKNIAFGLTLFYYDIYTGFSGQDLYDDWYMVMFNVLLTSLPVISLGVLEQDVSSSVCLQVKHKMQHRFPQNTIIICSDNYSDSILTFLVTRKVSSPLSAGTKEYLLQLEAHRWLDIKRHFGFSGYLHTEHLYIVLSCF